MNFKQATDALLESITLEDLAKVMGVSVQALRQARTVEESMAYRTPPEGWERAVAELSLIRGGKLVRLAKALK
jgi:hypothetical protein